MNAQQHPVRRLLWIWLALLVLLAATTASAWIDLGAGNSIANLIIAGAKAALIALFFMHLRRSDATVRLAAGAALLFLFFLAFLTFDDYLTRPMHPAPWRSPQDSTLNPDAG
jgi:cytochrome c oxidase subunit 4